MAFPLKPPAEWFDAAEASEPTPLTFDHSGRVYGHLALWNQCHTGFLNGGLAECVRPPRSQNLYASFHLGTLETADGAEVRVGKITYDTSHAPLASNMQAAARHYDDTGRVGAFVRASDGQIGIWLSGAVRSDISPEGFRDMRANPPSGDWRSEPGNNLALIASLSVPVPGFPIPASQLALAASGEIAGLILPGYTCDCEEPRSKQFLRQRTLIAVSLE